MHHIPIPSALYLGEMLQALADKIYRYGFPVDNNVYLRFKDRMNNKTLGSLPCWLINPLWLSDAVCQQENLINIVSGNGFVAWVYHAITRTIVDYNHQWCLVSISQEMLNIYISLILVWKLLI